MGTHSKEDPLSSLLYAVTPAQPPRMAGTSRKSVAGPCGIEASRAGPLIISCELLQGELWVPGGKFVILFSSSPSPRYSLELPGQ
jgi:hypothetical protein